MQSKTPRRALISWMLFDWAAQPFFTVILTFIFGPYFVSRLVSDPNAGQAAWGYTVTVSGVIIALLSPVMGAIADASGARKKWIGLLAIFQIIATLLLWFAAPGTALWLPMLCVVVATVAAEFSIVFNDSMMPRLVQAADVGRVSNLAWGLGYLGGLVALFFVLMCLAANPATGKTLIGIPALFGLNPALGEDARASGPLAAIWYLIFVFPLFLFVPETDQGKTIGVAIREGLTALNNTLKELPRKKALVKFLVARMLYQDGINGLLALGGTFAAGMFGWQTIEMGIYGILLLVIAIFGCYFAGRLDSQLGSKNVVFMSLLCLIIATIGIVSTGPGYTLFGWISLSSQDSNGLFGTLAEKIYILYGLLIGLVFGPAQASSRAFLARSVPLNDAGKYFGIYALTGRATSFMAPLAVASLTLYANSARVGMAVLIVFLVVGALLLTRTPYPANDES